MSGDFASRWSERRKRVADDEAEHVAREQAIAPEPDEATLAEHDANRRAAEAIDLASLGTKTDMSVFLRAGVPDALRRSAFRALWRSDPVFSNLDRLNEYDENFRDPARTLKTLASAWQAGRGYLFDDEDAASDEATAADEDGGPAGGIAERGGEPGENERPLEAPTRDETVVTARADEALTQPASVEVPPVGSEASLPPIASRPGAEAATAEHPVEEHDRVVDARTGSRSGNDRTSLRARLGV